MLIYPVCFSYDYAHSFQNFLFPDASSGFLFLYLFRLLSWTFLLGFVAFSDNTRFMP